MIVLNQPCVVHGAIQPGLEDMSGGSPGIVIGHSDGLALFCRPLYSSSTDHAVIHMCMYAAG
jgi:hypothetical protein